MIKSKRIWISINNVFQKIFKKSLDSQGVPLLNNIEIINQESKNILKKTLAI